MCAVLGSKFTVQIIVLDWIGAVRDVRSNTEFWRIEAGLAVESYLLTGSFDLENEYSRQSPPQFVPMRSFGGIPGAVTKGLFTKWNGRWVYR